jgi:hypothetical protein
MQPTGSVAGDVRMRTDPSGRILPGVLENARR